MLRRLTAVRYITPLREGGSLPAIAEADDQQLYVIKFRGAGQGRKALIAEVLAGEIARALGLSVPELVLLELDPAFGRTEPDPEIQDLLRASAGLNLGMAYLPGALSFDPLAEPAPAARLASRIVWLDAYVTNVDRTIKNPNLLWWRSELWLIDHGAALYFHHMWQNYSTDQMAVRSHQPFAPIRDHVLLPRATEIGAVDRELAARLNEDILPGIAAAIPDEWLREETAFAGPDAARAAYREYLARRLELPRLFVEEAIHAQSALR